MQKSTNSLCSPFFYSTVTLESTIEAIPEAFNHDNHISSRGGSTVIIGAVDNWAVASQS